MEEKTENTNINGDSPVTTDTAMNVNCNRVSGDRTVLETAMNCNHGNGINGDDLQAERVAILDAGAQYGKVKPTAKICLFAIYRPKIFWLGR